MNVQAIGQPARIRIETILAATDFSPAAAQALPFAVALAKSYEAKLHLLHVVESLASLGADPDSPALAELRTGADQRMQDVVNKLDLDGVNHQAEVEVGDVVETVLRRAAEVRAGLIVVGTQGRRGIRKLLLGSIAEEILRTSECPVLTVGPQVKPPTGPAKATRHVLLPVDFSPHSQPALSYALSLAQENDARLTLLHVLEGDIPNAPEMEQGVEQTCRRRLEQMMPAGAAQSRHPHVLCRFGSPARQILEVAREVDADLIVMGTRGAGALARAATHRLGAITHQVITGSECPVLTVPGAARS